MTRARSMRHAARDLVWAEIRRRKVFRRAELRLPGVAPDTVSTFLRRLVKAGLVVAAPRTAAEVVYTLARDVGRRCPRFDRTGALNEKPTPRERMWAAMRPLRGGFSIVELASLARAEWSATRAFVGALHTAGYLVAVEGGVTPRYRLAAGKNTGPEPPRVLAEGLYDPNLRRMVWVPAAAEAAQ